MAHLVATVTAIQDRSFDETIYIGIYFPYLIRLNQLVPGGTAFVIAHPTNTVTTIQARPAAGAIQ